MSPDPAEALFARLTELAPEGYNFGFHIRYSRPSVVKLTYREDWSKFYSNHNFILSDPSVIWGLTNTGAKRWSEIDLPDPLDVFGHAKNYGYNFGVSIGCGDSNSKTLGSAARADREFNTREIENIRKTVEDLHDLLDMRGKLKQHQIDALQAKERGLTYDEICEKLDISRTALKNRFAGARRALGVETNDEALRVAIERGLLEATSYTGVIKGLAGSD